MKTTIRISAILLLTGILFACATGEYMQMNPSEHAEVLGIVQTTFNVTGAFRYRSTINKHSYISLMAQAQQQYPGLNIDIRDISWAIGGGDAANNTYEYSAIGKVIKVEN